jgi:hypothetical protein
MTGANKARSSNGSSSNGRRRSDAADDLSPAQLAQRASRELAELLGRAPEAIVSLDRTEDGWRVGVEVLETRRIPDTADVLAEYEIDADEHGRLLGYRRTRRYARGRVQDTR